MSVTPGPFFSQVLFSHWFGFWLSLLGMAATIYFMVPPKGSPLVSHGPLWLCVVSTPFLLTNQILNILADYHSVDDQAPLIKFIIGASAAVGSVGVLVAVFWNARFCARLEAAWQGEEFDGCALHEASR